MNPSVYNKYQLLGECCLFLSSHQGTEVLYNIKRIESMINSLLKRELRLSGCLLIQYSMALTPSSWLMFVYKLVTSKRLILYFQVLSLVNN